MEFHVSRCLIVFALLLSCSHAASPNFVIILTDDQGYADLGCFGSEDIATPNIDQLAAEGAKLTCFYAAAPICTPTRAALMTGAYANRVHLPTPLHVYDEIGLPEKTVTLGELLQRQGYQTACIGKWHLGHVSEHYPTRHGFDFYFGTPLGHMFDRPAVGKAIGDTSQLFLNNESELPFPAHADITQQLTDRAVKYIQRDHQQPFFLYLAHSMPHEPLAVSDKFAGKSAGGLYGDVIECIDWSTGQVVDALREQGLLENTVLIFTSDNGPKKGHGKATPLRGYKHQPYEGGVRVPCVVYSQGRIPAGRVIDEITTIMDLYPTFAHLSGADLPATQTFDGKNIWPLLTGETKTSPHQEFTYIVRHGVVAGVRDEQWKLLEQKGKVELFDLSTDVSESKDMADERPKIVTRLKRRLKDIRAEIELSN